MEYLPKSIKYLEFYEGDAQTIPSAALTNLKFLFLNTCDLTDTGLEVFSTLTNPTPIRYLNLSENNIPKVCDLIGPSIEKGFFPNLSFLVLKDCGIEEIILLLQALTIGGIKLKNLNLSSNEITLKNEINSQLFKEFITKYLPNEIDFSLNRINSQAALGLGKLIEGLETLVNLMDNSEDIPYLSFPSNIKVGNTDINDSIMSGETVEFNMTDI